ncbi:hypothetical protein M758_7G178900 [Ceratodon purpureus]|uniref:Uncharacterized protein n=1 Tax=Ceratodon purpureus TaxID=3225 RepID=A0A8T0HC94_CERPU|nr:hypothetical protein KC19_7G181400 [Ceratodon purpureus]KAG0611950.1 hypothetical protein M758_7G178900 [Ceratodon purpureus]
MQRVRKLQLNVGDAGACGGGACASGRSGGAGCGSSGAGCGGGSLAGGRHSLELYLELYLHPLIECFYSLYHAGHRHAFLRFSISGLCAFAYYCLRGHESWLASLRIGLRMGISPKPSMLEVKSLLGSRRDLHKHD